MTENENGGLRERKKVATREAIREAALNLALEHGPENVRVDDIAEAAGVSPRTYNNYFSSREQAIVAAVAAERTLRIATALRERPADEPLAEAVVETLVEQYGADAEPAGDKLLLITTTPGLRAEFVNTVTAIEQPLTSAIADRTGIDDRTAEVLAAAVTAAARVAIKRWVHPAENSPQRTKSELLVVPQGSLADILRETLAPLVPALQAADPVTGAAQGIR